jgi:hypothetical protein
MTKVYVLFYDHDGSGAREEWNTFYTPCEVFATVTDRDVRKAALSSADPDLCFHELDLEMPPSAAVAAMGSGPNSGGSGDANTPEMTEEEMMKAMMPKPTYHGAPADMDAAIERIIELELRLGDLHRAAEIATVVRDFTLIEGQMPEAEKSLETKIVVEYPNAGHQPITVITGQYDPAKAGVTGAGTP